MTGRQSEALFPEPFAWVNIPQRDYAIAKFPITNAQYDVFIGAGGYGQREWWTEAGWEAKQRGLSLDWTTGGPAEGTPWDGPRFRGDPKFDGADHPVIGVSWFEAVAFCRWLSDASGEAISLPTEAQWQYAAQGEDGRRYPWGDEWDCTRCNNSVAPCQSDSTTPVRQYEGIGDSPFGVVDMSGNVWEWCLSGYDNPDAPIDDGAAPRVIKGGGWFHFTKADCRLTFRYSDVPYASYNFRGLRIVRG
jgi:formylglycine-generating enzyme required for sulfatase activity